MSTIIQSVVTAWLTLLHSETNFGRLISLVPNSPLMGFSTPRSMNLVFLELPEEVSITDDIIFGFRNATSWIPS